LRLFDVTAERLEEDDLKSVKQLAILKQGIVSVVAAHVDAAALVRELARDLELESQVLYQIAEKLGRLVTRFLHF